MSLHKSEARLLSAVTSPVRRDDELREAITGCRDWESLLRSAQLNRVLFQLAVVLKQEGLLEHVPEKVRAKLTPMARQASLLDAVHVTALAEIIDAFESSGTPFILLKGLGLAERLYARPVERISMDIDILTRADQTLRAGELLEALGYEAQQRDFYRGHHFHVPYRKPGASLSPSVELHWQVTKKTAQVSFDVDSWWDRAREHQLRAGRVLLVPPADEFVYLCHHGFVEGSTTLKNLEDAARFYPKLEADGEWPNVLAAARRSHALMFVRRALLITTQLWSKESDALPEPSLASRRREWLTRNLMDSKTVLSAGGGTWWPYKKLTYWSMLDPGRSRFLDLLRRTGEISKLFQPMQHEEARPGHSLELYSLLLALAFCCLPLRLFPPRFRQG